MPTRYDLDRDELGRPAGRRAALPRRPGVGRPLRPAGRAGRADRRCPRRCAPGSTPSCPPALTPVAESVSDGGDTVKWLWRARRRRPGRDRAHALPRPGHGVRVAPRPAAPWAAGSAPPARPASSATSRAGEIVEQVVRAARRAPRAGRRLSQRRVHGHGRAARQLRPRCGPRSSASTATSACRPGTSRSRRSGIVPGIRRLAAEAAAGQPRRVAARGQRRAARRAGADQPALPARRC